MKIIKVIKKWVFGAEKKNFRSIQPVEETKKKPKPSQGKSSDCKNEDSDTGVLHDY